MRAPVVRSFTKMSDWLFVSSGTRFGLLLTNARNRPSALRAGLVAPTAGVPSAAVLTYRRIPVVRSFRNTPGVARLVRFEAWLANATYRPSALIDGTSRAFPF